MCTAKSAYNTLAISYAQLHPPPTIPTQTIDILKQVWKDKSMRPRIKTFAWRILEGPDRRPEGGGLNGSLKFDPKNEEEKSPDTNTTPLLLKCANTTQHGQAASARNTIRMSQNSCGSKTREHTQSDSKTS